MSKINWSQALVDYLTDETVSYNSLATKYGVSKRAIVNHAKQDNWQDLRTTTSLKVHQKLPEVIGNSLAEVSIKQVDVANKLIKSGLDAITEGRTPKTPQDARLFIVSGIDIERKAMRMDEQPVNSQNTMIIMSKEVSEWAT